MILSVLEDVAVLDIAMSLVAANNGNNRKLKRFLRRVEDNCDTESGKELVRIIRMKITQMEDQWDGTL